MIWFSLAVALAAALAIIGIGLGYLARPMAMAPSFGLAPPADDTALVWWLRPKGVRDVVCGVLVLAFMSTGTGGHRALGLVLLVAALIPLGDMTTVLAAKGHGARRPRRHGGGDGAGRCPPRDRVGVR